MHLLMRQLSTKQVEFLGVLDLYGPGTRKAQYHPIQNQSVTVVFDNFCAFTASAPSPPDPH